MSKNIPQLPDSLSQRLQRAQSRSLENRESRTLILNLTIEREELSGLDLNCADFQGCHITNTVFHDCDLRGASFRESLLEGVTFIDCATCDLTLSKNSKAIVLQDCSNLPSGLSDSPVSRKEQATTPIGQILTPVESIIEATSRLSVDKLLSLAVILAFVTIIILVLARR